RGGGSPVRCRHVGRDARVRRGRGARIRGGDHAVARARGRQLRRGAHRGAPRGPHARPSRQPRVRLPARRAHEGEHPLNDSHIEAATAAITKRTRERFERYRERTLAHTDALFAKLLVGEWLFGIVLALVISPYAWEGKTKVVHLHVWIAVLLGGAIISLPIALALKRPGATMTRHVV